MSTAVLDARAKTAKRLQEQGPWPLLDAAEEKKAYHVIVQLGARVRWRNLQCGRWQRNPAADDSVRKVNGWVHIPAVHEVGPISGKTLNGLLSAHNRWLEANREKAMPAGDVSRQLIVVSFAETDEPPKDIPVPRLALDAVEHMLDKLATKLVEKLFGAQTATATTASAATANPSAGETKNRQSGK